MKPEKIWLALVRYFLGDTNLLRAFASLPTNVSEHREIVGFMIGTDVEITNVRLKSNPRGIVISDVHSLLRLPEHRAHVLFDPNYDISRPQGIILNLAGLGLKAGFLSDKRIYTEYRRLKKHIGFVNWLALPTVFAVQDPQDLFPPLSMKPHLMNNDPKKFGEPWIDVWADTSPELETIKAMLDIPTSVPIVPYSHAQPDSIETILTTLLREIEISE